VNVELPVLRSEFGFERTECGCAACSMFCRLKPGYLVPGDLERLIPPGHDPVVWAKVHLRARLVQPGGLPSLVPARQSNGPCHWLESGKCAVWRNSPYGCAFFGHLTEEEAQARNQAGRAARQEAFERNALYAQIWHALKDAGLTTAGMTSAVVQGEVQRLNRHAEKIKRNQERKKRRAQRKRR
jgi:hypothetical protein